MYPGQLRHFNHALRTDHDVRQFEPQIRERAEKSRVKESRSGVAFPALAGGRILIDAILRERPNQSLEVALVFGNRVFDPKSADRLMEFWCDLPGQSLLNGRHRLHGIGRTRWVPRGRGVVHGNRFSRRCSLRQPHFRGAQRFPDEP